MVILDIIATERLSVMEICCQAMECYLHCLEQGDEVVCYSPKFNEYGIPIHDGENGSITSYIQIQYCPWCGKKLPDGLREKWFDQLENLGYDDPLKDDSIPEKFKSDKWYRK